MNCKYFTFRTTKGIKYAYCRFCKIKIDYSNCSHCKDKEYKKYKKMKGKKHERSYTGGYVFSGNKSVLQ